MTATTERRWIDRRARVRFRFPERRTGFDRRSPRRVLTWYRDRPRFIAAVLGVVFALNILDLLLTNRALALGAVEANPIMAALFEVSPALAASLKLLVTGGVVAVIWNMRRYRRILEVSLIALVGFGALVAYQLFSLLRVA